MKRKLIYLQGLFYLRTNQGSKRCKIKYNKFSERRVLFNKLWNGYNDVDVVESKNCNRIAWEHRDVLSVAKLSSENISRWRSATISVHSKRERDCCVTVCVTRDSECEWASKWGKSWKFASPPEIREWSSFLELVSFLLWVSEWNGGR